MGFAWLWGDGGVLGLSCWIHCAAVDPGVRNKAGEAEVPSCAPSVERGACGCWKSFAWGEWLWLWEELHRVLETLI